MALGGAFSEAWGRCGSLMGLARVSSSASMCCAGRRGVGRDRLAFAGRKLTRSVRSGAAAGVCVWTGGRTSVGSSAAAWLLARRDGMTSVRSGSGDRLRGALVKSDVRSSAGSSAGVGAEGSAAEGYGCGCWIDARGNFSVGGSSWVGRMSVVSCGG